MADATGSEFYNVYSNRAASSLKLSRFFEELEFERLTSAQRTRVFIVDNSVMNRLRSKKVKFPARTFDHIAPLRAANPAALFGVMSRPTPFWPDRILRI